MRFLLLVMIALAGCSTTTSRQALPPLETVPHVDLLRYIGNWFEIASFPQRFQEGCVASRARYALDGDEGIVVVNQCREGSLDGSERIVTGVARVVDRETNAKLQVSFLWPFWGDYWIIDLDPQYRWAVVGHPSRDYLWILSRSPRLDAAVYDGILARLRQQKYDVARLRTTLQE